MRKLVAVALAVAVQAAGLSAPLVHAHPDALPRHHSEHVVHGHWAAHHQHHESSSLPAFGAVDDDRAVFLNAFVAVATASATTAAVTVEFAPVPVPPVRAAHRTLEITHSHDPPSGRSLPPRAPPAFLS